MEDTELKLEVTDETMAVLTNANISHEYFEAMPRAGVLTKIDVNGKPVAELRKLFLQVPEYAVLHSEVVGWRDDYWVKLEVRWERPETDEEWARRVTREVMAERHNAKEEEARERAVYGRLRLKYGNGNGAAQQSGEPIKNVADIWPLYKEAAKRHGIKIIGEDG